MTNLPFQHPRCCAYLKLAGCSSTMRGSGFDRCGRPTSYISNYFVGDHWGYLCRDCVRWAPRDRVWPKHSPPIVLPALARR